MGTIGGVGVVAGSVGDQTESAGPTDALSEYLGTGKEHWRPKVVARLNGQELKLVERGCAAGYFNSGGWFP